MRFPHRLFNEFRVQVSKQVHPSTMTAQVPGTARLEPDARAVQSSGEVARRSNEPRTVIGSPVSAGYLYREVRGRARRVECPRVGCSEGIAFLISA